MSEHQEGKDYIQCSVVDAEDGSKHWARKGETVFIVLLDGTKIDMRKSPPYLSMDPCPYCGATSPRVSVVSGHDPLKHVDVIFGKKTQ